MRQGGRERQVEQTQRQEEGLQLGRSCWMLGWQRDDQQRGVGVKWRGHLLIEWREGLPAERANPGELKVGTYND